MSERRFNELRARLQTIGAIGSASTAESKPAAAPAPRRVAAAGVKPAPQLYAPAPETVPAVEPATPAPKPGPELPSLPEALPDHSAFVGISFLICVVLPTVFLIIYYGLFAANQYVSEFRFSVTESSPVLPSVTGVAPPQSGTNGASSSPLASIASSLGAGAMTGASTQNYIVVNYLQSRQVVEDLQKRINIKALYDGPETSWDWWARFNSSRNMESFLDYWSDMMSANYDPVTGISTVKVRGFTPEKAHLIAETMVKLSEDLVNGIAKRSQLDAIEYAKREVGRTELALAAARQTLEDFRSQEGVIEPTSSVSTNSELIKTLKATLLQLRTDASLLDRQNVSGASATHSALTARIAATEAQLQKLQQEVNKDDPSGKKLQKTVARFEKLDLDRQYAQAMAVSARQMLDQARANAAAQHVYLTPFVRPAVPDSSTYPRRFQAIALRFIALVGLWFTGLMIAQAVRDHL